MQPLGALAKGGNPTQIVYAKKVYAKRFSRNLKLKSQISVNVRLAAQGGGKKFMLRKFRCFFCSLYKARGNAGAQMKVVSSYEFI